MNRQTRTLGTTDKENSHSFNWSNSPTSEESSSKSNTSTFETIRAWSADFTSGTKPYAGHPIMDRCEGIHIYNRLTFCNEYRRKMWAGPFSYFFARPTIDG